LGGPDLGQNRLVDRKVLCIDGGERSNASEVLAANFFHAVWLGHGMLPDTLAVA
jgi:hypothetical protein